VRASSDYLLGGLFLALAVALPLAFHLVGLGSIFLPMFFPVILAGYLLRLRTSMAVGLTAPLLSALLTGMPPFYPPICFIMMAEGLVLTAVPYVLFQKLKVNVWLSLAVTMAAERFVLFLAVVLASMWLDLPAGVLGLASLLEGIPGIILIFLTIPLLVIKIKTRIGLSPILNQESDS